MELWQEYFRECFDSQPFVGIGWTGQDKNMLAHNSKEEYVEWFCRPPGAIGEPYRDEGFYPRELTMISMRVQPIRILEIGTSIGIGSFMLSRLNPNAEVLTIDIEEEVPHETGLLHVGFIPKVNECSNVRVCKENSLWLSTDILKFNLVFIDGDHSEKHVRHDSNLAYYIINKADPWAIIWHDYREDHVGLRRAVDEFCVANELMLNKLPDSSTVWVEG